MTEREPRWAALHVVAKYAAVNASTIRRWTEAGIIPSYRIERSVRWDLNDIDDYFRASRNAR